MVPLFEETCAASQKRNKVILLDFENNIVKRKKT